MVAAGKKAAATRATGNYTFEQHIINKSDKIREIALAVQEFVMGLDPAIEETPKKLYVAYKIAQNILCLEIHKAKLYLYLKLNPKQIKDLPAFARDVTDIGHSAASHLLRTDHPQSMRALARMFGLPINWTINGALDYSVRTGRPATETILPGGYWSHFAERPEEAGIFNAAMVGKAYGQVAGVVAAYDFSGFGLLGDIGGGRGHLLQAILAAAPNTKGVLFDLPHVIAEATGVASERLSLQAGDFFTDALPVCDAYLFMEVIHDWGDAEAIAILKAVRQVAPPHAKLMLIEQIIPTDAGPHWSKTLDIHMLTLLGGLQRTRQEYEALFERSGFAFEREIDTGADISILEAVPV